MWRSRSAETCGLRVVVSGEVGVITALICSDALIDGSMDWGLDNNQTTEKWRKVCLRYRKFWVVTPSTVLLHSILSSRTQMKPPLHAIRTSISANVMQTDEPITHSNAASPLARMRGSQ